MLLQAIAADTLDAINLGQIVRLTAFFIMLLLQGCVTISAWNRGFPPVGKQLSEAQVSRVVDRFAIAKMGYEFVETNAGESKERFARHTFMPIMNQISPRAKAALAKGDLEAENANLILPLYTQALSFTVSSDWPRWAMIGRDVAIVGTAGIIYYFSRQAEHYYDEAVRQYNEDLRAALIQ